jgi:hypothetical protein
MIVDNSARTFVKESTMTRAVIATTAMIGLLFGTTDARAQNLILNGGFESGNTGFASDYSFSSGGNCCEGQYTVTNNPRSFNGFFVNPPPSSPGSSLMMVCNGATVLGLRVWYATVQVTPGQSYRLNARGCTAVAGGPAVLHWKVDAAFIGEATTLPTITQQWVGVPAAWTAPQGVTSITLAIENRNNATFPNDFYVDDLVMEVACRADFNADGFLDFFDYADFVACFEGTGTPGCDADFNADGFVDFFDYTDFVAAFEAGC